MRPQRSAWTASAKPRSRPHGVKRIVDIEENWWQVHGMRYEDLQGERIFADQVIPSPARQHARTHTHTPAWHAHMPACPAHMHANQSGTCHPRLHLPACLYAYGRTCVNVRACVVCVLCCVHDTGGLAGRLDMNGAGCD